MALASRTRRINIYINGKAVTNDIKSISAAMNELIARTRLLNRDSAEYVRNMANIRRLKAIIAEHNAALAATSGSLFTLKGLANAFNKYWPMVMGGIGALAGLVFSVKRATETFTEFDDKVSDVMKSTGLTREAVMRLNDEFKKLDTRTTKNDLMDLAYVAGKLGIEAEEDVLGFVRAADKIGVSLSKDLGGNVEDAVNTLGKLIKVFKLDEKYGIEEAMIRIGSAINELGMDSAAAEGSIVSFAKRADGMGKLAGVDPTDILGLGAAVDALGISTEVAGTAYIMFMGQMTKKTAEFADIAGMKLKDFQNLMNEDANEAMIRVLEALGRSEGGFSSLTSGMAEASMDGQRAIAVISTLAQQTEFLRQQQDLAALAFEQGTSVIDEFNIKNNNSQAILDKNNKQLKTVTEELGEKLVPVYIEGTSVAIRFIKTMQAVAEVLIDNAAVIASAVVTIISYQAAIRIATFLSKQWTAAQIFGKGIILLFSAAYYKLTGNITRANAAMRLLNATMKMNPWVLALSAVAALTVGLITYYRTKKDISEMDRLYNEIAAETTNQLDKQSVALETMFKKLMKSRPETERRRDLIKELNSLYPNLTSSINLETASVEKLGIAQKEYIKGLREQIELEIKQNKISDLREEYNKILADEKDPGFWQGLNPYFYDQTKKRKEEIRNEINALNEDIDHTINKNEFNADIADKIRQLDRFTKGLEKLKSGKKINFAGAIYEPDDENAIDYFTKSIKLLETQIEKAKAALLNPPATSGEKGTEHKIIYNDMWFYAQREKIQNDYYAGRIKTSDEYEQKLLNLEVDYMRKQLEFNNMNDEDRYKMKNELFQKLLQEHKKFGEKVTETDKWYYEQQSILRNKFLNGEIETELELTKLLDQLEIDYLRRQLETETLTADERIKIQEKLDQKLVEQLLNSQKRIADLKKAGAKDSLINQENEEYEQRLRDLGIFNRSRESLSELELKALESQQKAHHKKLNELDAAAYKEYFDNKINQFENEFSEMKLKHDLELETLRGDKEKYNALKKQYQEEERNFTLQNLQKIIDEINNLQQNAAIDSIDLSDAVLSPEETQTLLELITKINKAIADLFGNAAEKNIPQYDFRRGDTDILGFSAEHWLTFFNNLKEGTFGLEEMATAVGALSDAYSQYADFVAKIEDRNLSRKETQAEKEKEVLAKQLEFGLISQENYDQQIAKMDAALDLERAKNDRKQAVREKALALSQAAINTALAVTKLLDIPWLAVAAGIMGAAQIAIIAATPIPELPGAETGGSLVQRSQDGRRFRAEYAPQKRGFINRPTVITGENGLEYVIPSEAMQNPAIRSIIDNIEVARLNKSLASVNFNDIINRRLIPGRQSGGYISQAPANQQRQISSTSDPDLKVMVLQNTEAIRQLTKKLEKPFKGYVTLYGDKGFYDAIEEDEIIRSNANL